MYSFLKAFLVLKKHFDLGKTLRAGVSNTRHAARDPCWEISTINI